MNKVVKESFKKIIVCTDTENEVSEVYPDDLPQLGFPATLYAELDRTAPGHQRLLSSHSHVETDMNTTS